MTTIFYIFLGILTVVFGIGSFVVCQDYKKRLKEEEELLKKQLNSEKEELKEKADIADVVAANIHAVNEKMVEEEIKNEEKRCDYAPNTLSGARAAIDRLRDIAARGKDRLHRDSGS